jgi:hypothetical protein
VKSAQEKLCQSHLLSCSRKLLLSLPPRLLGGLLHPENLGGLLLGKVVLQLVLVDDSQPALLEERKTVIECIFKTFAIIVSVT